MFMIKKKTHFIGDKFGSLLHSRLRQKTRKDNCASIIFHFSERCVSLIIMQIKQ